MQKMLLAVSLIAIGAGLTGCRAAATTAGAISAVHARPLDNFGEILSPHKSATPPNATHGGVPNDNFGEIL